MVRVDWSRRASTALAGTLLALITATVAAPPVAPAEAADGPVKPLLAGLMTRDGAPPPELADVISSYALRLTWADLQPTAGGPLVTTTLDNALADAAARGARMKLRVLAGASAPGWAKELDGPPFTMIDAFNGQPSTVARFWTANFATAYADLQRRLAERYDANPVVAEVIISRCSNFYSEPFLRQTSQPANRTALLAAGYTIAADEACHREQITAHQVWTTTRSGLTLNPAQFVTATGDAIVSDEFTVDMMSFCRAELGERCVLENDSIRSPISSLDPNPAEPHYQRMYDAMVATGTPVAFQTAVEDRIGDCGATLEWAITMGATSVELPRNPIAGGCTHEVLAPIALRLGRPDGAISSPAPAQVFPTRPITLAGRASGVAGVGAVILGVHDVAGGRWWNGTGWQANATTVAAVLASPGATTTDWTYAFAPPAAGSFSVEATAVDPAGTADATPSAVTFSYAPNSPPTVSSRSPATDATRVRRTANVTATFSEPVLSVGRTTFTIRRATGGNNLLTSVTRNGSTNQWILNPATTLAPSTRYTVTLTGGATAIRDTAGAALSTMSWSFTTGA